MSIETNAMKMKDCNSRKINFVLFAKHNLQHKKKKMNIIKFIVKKKNKIDLKLKNFKQNKLKLKSKIKKLKENYNNCRVI